MTRVFGPKAIGVKDPKDRAWTAREIRWRDALMAAMLPAPGRGLPALAQLDLLAFWSRFEHAAPAHLRWGLRAATLALAGALPWGLGYGRSLDALDADARDRVLTRAAQLPVMRELMEVAKVVVCMAYFSDHAVQRVARSRA